jgi:hypothetical protein
MANPRPATPMQHQTDQTPPGDAADLVDIRLEGGPDSLPAELRRHRALTTAHTVKVTHCGGYEHFERDRAGVFRWTMRTRMAE